MRVYLPASVDDLRRLHGDGELLVSGVGYAATRRLAADLDGLGDEETEFALTSAAAEASLSDLADAGLSSGRRIVVVAEVAERVVAEREDAPGVVGIVEPVRLSEIAAILMDSSDVDTVVGSDDDLGWYATQELATLLA